MLVSAGNHVSIFFNSHTRSSGAETLITLLQVCSASLCFRLFGELDKLDHSEHVVYGLQSLVRFEQWGHSSNSDWDMDTAHV